MCILLVNDINEYFTIVGSPMFRLLFQKMEGAPVCYLLNANVMLASTWVPLPHPHPAGFTFSGVGWAHTPQHHPIHSVRRAARQPVISINYPAAHGTFEWICFAQVSGALGDSLLLKKKKKMCLLNWLLTGNVHGRCAQAMSGLTVDVIGLINGVPAVMQSRLILSIYWQVKTGCRRCGGGDAPPPVWDLCWIIRW